MCTLFGSLGTIDLPKEGRVVYRVVRVDKIKKQYTSVYTKSLGDCGKKFYPVLPLNKKMKAKTAYLFVSEDEIITLRGYAGFYVFKTFEEAMNQRSSKHTPVVRARIYGKAVEYLNGYRAEFMKIEAVCNGVRF